MITTLTSFVLIGTVISYDSFLATVEFNINPPVNGGEAIGILPVKAIPCKIEKGKKIFIIKHEKEEFPVISCKQ